MPLLEWMQTVLLRDQIPIWLDRRVPSDIEIVIDIPKDQTNKDVLEQVAAFLNAEVAYVDRFVVLAPKQSAAVIEWSYWMLSTDPSHPSLRAIRKEAFEWSDGSDTREVWRSLVEQYRLAGIVGSVGLVDDFDRWRAGRLESTNLAAITTLVLCGFDQRLSWPADGSPRIEPLLETYAQRSLVENGHFVRFSYTSEIPKIGKDNWQAWRSRWPQAIVERVSPSGPGKADAWDIQAPAAAHRQLVESLAPPAKPKPSNPASTKKYTGRYRGEILKILENLSQQLSLELVAKDLSVNLARQEVDVSFQDATLDDLLARLAQAAGLKISLQGRSLIVRQVDP